VSGREAQTYDRRLVLEAFEPTPDGGGGMTGAWRALGVHWARLHPLSARQRAIGEAARSEITHRAVVRWSAPETPSRPRPGQRFREGTRIYAVAGVAEADQQRDALLCWVCEGVRE
jgi:head-tail adaptor